jgi:uncharacterized membrane protein
MAFTFDAIGILVLLHVLFATVWFGGAVYQVRVIGPALMAAGPSGMGFVLTLARRRGIGWFFALSGGLAILFGGWLYGAEMADHRIAGAFDGRGLFLTLGAVMALLAYLHGLTSNMPTEKKWLAVCNAVKGTPTPEQGKQIAELGAKLGKQGVISVAMLGVAMLLMLLSRVFV